MVYVVVKEDLNEKMYKDDTSLIFGDILKFENFEECDGGKVKLANDIPCPMKGRGSLMFSNKIICDDAYWVQGLKYSLLSVSKLRNTSHKLKF